MIRCSQSKFLIKRYKSDEQADTYGKGWTNRADLVAENID